MKRRKTTKVESSKPRRAPKRRMIYPALAGVECPRCSSSWMNKIEDRSRPGWECTQCGVFFAKQTWEPDKNGRLKKKHVKRKKLSGYVDRDALAETNVLPAEGRYKGLSLDSTFWAGLDM